MAGTPEITATEEQVVVEPRAGASAPAETAETTKAGDLPDELLKVPAFQALVSGSPGAFSIVLSQFENRPEAKLLAANKDSLMKAGMGLYRGMDGESGVVFNQLFVSGDEVKAADQAGQLTAIAPPFDAVNAEIAKSGAANPVLAEGERPQGFKQGAGAPAPVPVTPSKVKPMAASAQKSLSNARSKNLQTPPPTGGAAPGSGRLLNTILKPILIFVVVFFVL